MATEIERKFLVNGDAWKTGDFIRIRQGYLNRDKERTVRVRIAGDEAYLTIKGITVGATRAEYEYRVPVADGGEMLEMCDGPLIEKNRTIIVYEGTTWEIDEFHGSNFGLVIAEVELKSEDQPFEKPDWLGAEVTDDRRYYNSNLVITPFSEW